MIRCRYCHSEYIQYVGSIHLQFGEKNEWLPQWHCKNVECSAHDSAQTYYPWHVVCEIDYTDTPSRKYTFAGMVHGEIEQEVIQTLFDDFDFINSHTDVINLNMKTFTIKHIERSKIL